MEVEIHVSHSASVDTPGPFLVTAGNRQLFNCPDGFHWTWSTEEAGSWYHSMDQSLGCSRRWPGWRWTTVFTVVLTGVITVKGFCFPVGLCPLARESSLLLGFLVIPFGISIFFSSNSWKNEAKETPKNLALWCSLGPRVPSWFVFLYLLCKWHARVLVVFSGKNRKKYIYLMPPKGESSSPPHPTPTHTHSVVCEILVS